MSERLFDFGGTVQDWQRVLLAFGGIVGYFLLCLVFIGVYIILIP